LIRPSKKSLLYSLSLGLKHVTVIKFSMLYFLLFFILFVRLINGSENLWNITVNTSLGKNSQHFFPKTLPTLLSGNLTRYTGNPLVPLGPDSYDRFKTGPRVVLEEGPNKFSMWYEAVFGPNKSYVGYATSSDGINWTKRGIVLSPSEAWEGGADGEVSPNSIIVEGNIYKLWYHSYHNGHRRIGYATARRFGNAFFNSRLLKWRKHPTPVLDLGPPGSLDDQMVVEPRVFRVGNLYRMYYGAMRSTQQGVGVYRLMMATSSDGINWTKSGNSLFGPYDSGYAIIFENGMWHMWFGRSYQGLGYAWSKDGISWQEGDNSVVLGINPDTNAPDSVGVGDSVSVYKAGNTYRILYTGLRGYDPTTNTWPESICMATITVP